MSVTTNTIIKSALRLIQVLAADQSPTAQEAEDGRYALNSMTDAWSVERLMIFQVQQTTHSWPANTTSRTIGSGGNFNVARPVKVEQGCFFRDGSQDYPVQVIEREAYDAQVLKSTGSSYPEVLAVDYGFPLVTLYAYPVPGSALTLHLNTWRALQSFPGLTTELSMPPGYQAAIEANLAIWIAPEYGAAAVAAAERIAPRAALLKASLKSINQSSLISQVEYSGSWGVKADFHAGR